MRERLFKVVPMLVVYKPRLLTMPMHFFRMLQMLTSFLENMGAGRHVLRYTGGRNIISSWQMLTPVNHQQENQFPSDNQCIAGCHPRGLRLKPTVFYPQHRKNGHLVCLMWLHTALKHAAF